MSKAVPKEGPRAPLFFSVAALLLVSANIATAQTVDFSELELCAGLETPELKLACFEAIVAGSKTTGVPASEALDIPESEKPVAEIEAVSPADSSVAEVEAMSKAEPAAVASSTAAVVATTGPSTAAAPAKPEPSAATVSKTPVPVTSSRLGEEHLERPETEEAKEDEVFHATVTEVSKGRNKILYFHFANGQVWRQIEARNFQYPRSGEFDINITRGMMGDYRMRIGDNGRMVRIRRVE